MAIIDLDNPQKRTASNPSTNVTGGIIDLDTGEMLPSEQSKPEQANQDPLMELQDLLARQASSINREDLGPRIAELRKLTDQPDSGELAVKSAGIAETLFGTAREELRPELVKLPEFSSSNRVNKLSSEGLQIAAGLLTTADPKEQQDIIRSIIPGATFETDNAGTTTVEVPDGEGGRERSVLNKPGLSQQDFLTGIAQMLAFTPAARVAGLAKGLASRLGIASIASAGTEAGRQVAAIAQGSEQGIKPVEVAAAGLFGPLGEILGPAKSLRRPEVSTAVTDQAEQAVRGLEAATGKRVGLFKAQQSLRPSELVEQSLLPQLDAGSVRAAKGLKKQNREVFDAATELINRISPESEIAAGSERFRTASNLVIDAAKSRRRTASSGLFNSALKEGANVNTSPVKDIINESLKDAVEGSQKSILKKTLRTLKGAKKTTKNISESFDLDEPLTHGTPDLNFTGEIKKGDGVFDKFDGVFTSRGTESQYGNSKKEITYYLPKNSKGVMDEGDVDIEFADAEKFINKNYDDLTEEEFDGLYDIIMADKDIFDMPSNPLERFGFDDLGEASWEAQNMRGKFANESGFDAVSMSDEFGESVFIPFGSRAKPISDESISAGSTGIDGDVPPTLRQLDNAKDAINAQLEKKAGSALDIKTKRLLVKVKNELVSQMEAASPTYKNAMDEFRRLSPEVERLEKSILGITAGKQDTQLKNIAQTIFDPKEGLTNPQAVSRAKKLIDEVDPGAWDDLLRVELNRRVGGIQEIGNAATGDLAGNTPGQLRRAIFGNPSQRNILMKSASDEQRRNLRYLDVVLERSEKGRSAGSSTIPNKEALEKLRGPYAIIRDMILKPREFLASKGGQDVFDRNVSALTDVLFDTRFQKDMMKLRKLNPESKESERLFSRIITQAARQQEAQ